MLQNNRSNKTNKSTMISKVIILCLPIILIACKPSTSAPAVDVKKETTPAKTKVEEDVKAIENISKDVELKEGSRTTSNLDNKVGSIKSKKSTKPVSKTTKDATQQQAPTPVSKKREVSTQVTRATNATKSEAQTAVEKPVRTAEKAKDEIVYYEKPLKEAKTVEDVPRDDAVTNSPPKAVVLNHANFDALLSKHVSAAGKVNYQGIKSEVSKLDAYLSQLEQTDVAGLDKKAQLAFWINAYNAYTIKKIVTNYPVASITDLDGGKPWDVKWIKLDGKTLSLNNIENDIIRPAFNEPRIHFAVNCAAKSCPPILNKAWTASNLESNFVKQSKAFINDSQHNILTASKVTLSKIFEWYAVDFGNLIDFLNKYSAVKINPEATVEYKEYDWALNN